MTDKLDLFEVLGKLDIKDIDWFDKLNSDQQKQLVPVVLMQWLFCGNNHHQLLILNEYVNRYIFSLYKHPKLLIKLLMVATTGKKQFYKWSKPKNKVPKYPKSKNLLQRITDESVMEIETYFHLIPSANILLLASTIGLQQDAIKDLQKELKDRSI